MKKFISMLTAISILCGVLTCSVSAATPSMTDKEYEAAVAEIMSNYQADPDAAKLALSQLDTTLIGEPQITEYYSESVTRGTSPSDYTHTVYSFKRGGSKIYYLQWSLTANESESFPGPLDYCSLEWDNSYASYYLSSGDDVMTTVQAKNTGIVLFNVEDSDLDKGEYTYGTVQVTPKKSGWMEYGSKFVHTYTSLLVSGSATVSFSPSPSLSSQGESTLGVSGNFGFTVNVGSQTKQWQIWADNAVNLP